MRHATLVLLLMCLGASHSVHLTKEIVLTPVAQSAQVSQFSNIISHLLQPSEAIVSNLATVLSSSVKPKVPEILDAVNSGLGLKLLIIVGESVQVDALELQAALVKAAKDVSRKLYPNDYIKQIATYAVMQNKAVQISTQVQDTIAATRIPVKQFEELLDNRDFLMKRDIHKRDIISDLVNSALKTLQSEICNFIVSKVQTIINSTLISWKESFEDIDVESSGDPVSTILSSVLDLGIFFIEQSLNYTVRWLENNAGSTCTSLLSSASDNTSNTAVRKRRDANETLSSVLQRDIVTDIIGGIFQGIFGGVWSILWGLISIAANPALKFILHWTLELLESVIDGTVDSVFPSIFG